MKYMIQYVHKISPRASDKMGPVEIPDSAFSNRNTLGAALRKVGVLMSGARINSFRVQGIKVVAFPSAPGLTTYWYSIIITPEHLA
jgi:hypothetical protein